MPAELPDFDGLLDWPRLQEWIVAQEAIPGRGPVRSVEALAGGSQNHIFRMARDGGEFVLRRPPRHLRKNSNETMVREARVLGALRDSSVPHPRLFAACADTAVIGVCFYVMAPVDGFNPVSALPEPYASDGAWRRAVGEELVDGAAQLAAIDPLAVGLGDFGKADGWLERQVPRWRAQLESYAQLPGYDGPELPGVARVGEWLDAHRPATCHIGIIHGDYQFANVIFSRTEPRLAAIVDWELSTLGDPMLDLAWMLQGWGEAGDPPGRPTALWGDAASRAELVARYGAATGRDMTDYPWYFALACYKLGIILEGTHARAAAGQAPKEIGDMLHAYTLWLFAMATHWIDAH